MEHNNQNLKLTSLLGTNQSSKFDKNRKFLVYCRSRKEDIVSGEMPLSYSNCLQKIKKYKAEESSPKVMILKCPQKPEKILKRRKELSKYKKDLNEFANNTKELEKRYTKINSELNEMKKKHSYIITNRHLSCGDADICSDSESTSTDYSLQRKNTHVFERNSSFIKILTSKQPLQEVNNLPNEDIYSISMNNNQQNEKTERPAPIQSEDKENLGSFCVSSSSNQSLDNEYYVLSSEADRPSKKRQGPDVAYLRTTIAKLQNESDRFCTIIEKQKNALNNYRLCFAKAKHLVSEQRSTIEQLNSKNQQLEKDASQIIDEMHDKIETKLRDVDHLTDRMKGEQIKKEFILKENCALKERMQVIEAETKHLKKKLEEMSSKKVALISRLKVAERDLKIFKNYNAALKDEKRKLNEELKSLSEQVNNMENTSKRSVNRQREQTEKQRRQLQRRIFELEVKLNRSQNSSQGLIQERDSLISELQSQLNNLVHNFEVSQKHIRVLRRHIYSMSGTNEQQTGVPNRL